MEIYSPKLYIEINNSEYIFAVGDENEKKDFKIIYKSINQLQGIQKNRITDFELVFNIIKKNVYAIEQELNFTFKEIFLIINNFDCSFINLTGYKKLNGSQILKENIIYILNSIKSIVNENEKKKIILHIFNSKYVLDKKKIENLPIGLFGDFYSQEMSLSLINENDYKNLENIFNKCNLKIKKILLKSFVEGSYISNKNVTLDTFYQIKINANDSQLFYFENDSLKFEQSFDFGSDLIIRDISKVTSLKIEIVKKIINNFCFTHDTPKEELLEKEMFENESYIKIKKRLLLEISESRIEELLQRILVKNINLLSFNRQNKTVFIKINDQSHYKCFKNIYSLFFVKYNKFVVNFSKNISTEDLMNNVNKIVHFGWKKEAVPIIDSKKSLIARFFDTLFS
jgi:cell division protein FtsA